MLHRYVAHHSPGTVELLLERGARVDALFLDAEEEWHRENIEPIETGSVLDYLLMTALHVAAAIGELESAEILIRFGADLEARGRGVTPLFFESLVVVSAKLEQGLDQAKPGERFQFLRQGYFVVDPDSTPEAPVFNRTVALRDTWSRMNQARRKG